MLAKCATCCFFSSCARDAVDAGRKLKVCQDYAHVDGDTEEQITHDIECDRDSYRDEWFEYVKEYDEDYLYSP